MSDTTTAAPPTGRTFADFGVDPVICDSLAEIGITSPFPIQELTLPLALSGADIIGQARTGTGKTLGFGLPLLQRVKLDGGLQVLIVVPTRELCMQVAEDLAQAGKGKRVKVVALYGGKAMQPQIDGLEAGAHVVVGTPGRLLDLSRRGHLKLGSCTGLVLDEADEMLDLGFLPDVEQLIEMCADKRQTLLFSATMPAAIVSLARRYMTKPTFMRADVEEINIAPKTKQFFFSCHRMDKPAVLARILTTPKRGLCLVFCRTKRMADTLAEELRDRDVPAQAIHSDLRQEARERALQKFREGKTTVLCATEVAARGLDIDSVTHVVNYDCPDDEKMYLHRIGRTGRAGADGVAITFAVWNEIPRLEMIRRELDIDEEIREIFSTSPLLEELFDLPVREERAKVPSPPQARSAKPSKSRRRAEKGEGQAERPPRSERSITERAERSTSQPATRPKDNTATAEASGSDEQQVRRRRRRRGQDNEAGADASTPASGTTRSSTARSDGSTSDTSPATSSGSRPDQDDFQAGDSTITRRRRRRGGRDDDGSASEGRTPMVTQRVADHENDRDTDNDADSDAGSDADQAERSTRTRTRSARGGRASTPRAEVAEPGARGDQGGARGRTGAGKDSRSREQSGARQGGSDGEQSPRGGERGGKARGGKGRGGEDRTRSGSNGRNERNGSGRERPGRSTVDASQARGAGQPRLGRKMEVQHLP